MNILFLAQYSAKKIHAWDLFKFCKLEIKLEMPAAKGDDHWEHQCCHTQCLSMILDSKEEVKLLASLSGECKPRL